MIPTVKKVNLSTQLVEAMVKMIETGDWKIGMKLPSEVDMAVSFHVSRNIMRESLKVMEKFGILDSQAGKGTFVSDTAVINIHNMHFFESLKSNSSIEMLLETRLIIEPELTYYATLRCTDEEIRSLRDILQNDVKKHEILNFFHTDDFDFHVYIARYSRNTILSNLLFTILDQLKSSDYAKFNNYVDVDVKNESFVDHLTLLEAMEKRDPLLARDIMYDHIFSRITIINSSYDTDMILSRKRKEERMAEEKDK